MDNQDQSRGRDEAIAETRAAFAAALERGDAKAIAEVYSEEARLLPPTSDVVQGRRAIEAFWRAGIESGIKSVELESLEVVPHGRLAHEIGVYALRLEPAEGDSLVDRGKYLRVHARQDDGSWRWAVEMFNADSPPARDDQSKEGERR